MNNMSDSDSDPPGFQLYRRDEFRSVELFVPTQLKSVLLEDEKKRRKEEEAKEAEINHAQSLQNRSAPPTYSSKPKIKDDPESEMLVWSQIDDTDKILRSRTSYPVFQSGQAIALYKNLGRGDSENKERLERIYQELTLRGTTLRKIARPKSLRPLEELAARQPHMKAVLN